MLRAQSPTASAITLALALARRRRPHRAKGLPGRSTGLVTCGEPLSAGIRDPCSCAPSAVTSSASGTRTPAEVLIGPAPPNDQRSPDRSAVGNDGADDRMRSTSAFRAGQLR